MATYTWTRTALDSVVITTENPNSNAPNSQKLVYPDGTGSTSDLFNGAVVVEFEQIPEQYRKKVITDITTRVYGKAPWGSGNLNVASLTEQSLSAVTWSGSQPWNAPQITGGFNTDVSAEKWIEVNIGASVLLKFAKIQFYAFSWYRYSEKGTWNRGDGTTMYTEKSQFSPYLVFEFEDADLKPANVSPASGYVNDKNPVTLRWGLPAINSVEEVTQKSALIEWKTVGPSTVNSITVTGSTTSATIPANTFPASAQIQWRVTVTSTDDVVGTPSDWYTLTTVDSTDMTATPVAPVSTYLDGSAPQVFSWNYAISTGSAPSGYRLQYSADAGSSWVTFSSGTGSATSATVPANTFPAGSILWRVSAANSDGIWSEWSAPAQIVVVAAPPAPSLSVDATTARPVFSWQSEGQVAWDLNLTDSTGAVIFDTGATYGAAKSYQSPEFLPNGNYTVTLTVVNQYGINSDPAVAGFSLSLPALTPPTAEANASGESVVITASTEGFETLYVLRNGIPIGVMNGGEFTDFSALGVNLYTVRGVTADGNFADSEPVAAQVEVKGTVLTSTEDPQQMIRLWLRKGADTVRDSSLTLTSASTHYAGRSLPVVEFSEFVDENLQFAFSFVERSKIQSLSALIKAGKTLLYRDHAGDRFFITVSSVRFDRDHIAQDFTISAQKVDYVEKISY